MEPVYSQSDLEAIAKALAHTTEGLTGSEIGHLLNTLNMSDPNPTFTKWQRLHNAFVERQNHSHNRRAINEFIRQALSPARYVGNHARFETMRANVNRALAFSGLAVDEGGTLHTVAKAKTIPEAQRRADELRADLTSRGVHADVLTFCRAELVVNDYFHAVQEAAKSIADKIRTKTGEVSDGAPLVQATLGGSAPRLAINAMNTHSEKSEQTGFVNLLIGVFGMFRNPTAHAPRVQWTMTKEDAEDILSIISLIHRRLDSAR